MKIGSFPNEILGDEKIIKKEIRNYRTGSE